MTPVEKKNLTLIVVFLAGFFYITGIWFSGWIEADPKTEKLLSACRPLTAEESKNLPPAEKWEECKTIRIIK